MILVFGGTTEGRKTIKELEEAGSPYFYSTKTGEQDVALHHGQRIDGALDYDAMLSFCRTHDIRLLIDAAHPFAAVLHQTVADVARTLHIAAIRFERIFPPRNPAIHWLDSYDDLITALAPFTPHPSPFSTLHPSPFTLLATTGVQSISKLKPLEAKGIRVLYRILPRPSSVALAHRQGATDDQLCFYREDESFRDFLASHALVAATATTALLLKESGLTGGFQEKADTALALGMPVFALKRPATPAIFSTVNGEHGLRRMVEKLLPDFFPLHSGLTTGTCATAAAMADVLHRQLNLTPAEVPVVLPNGETIHVAVGYADDYAYVMKDSGDDPDVTNGMEIRASVALKRKVERGKWKEERGERREERFSFIGGEGVGTFTLPGFDFPPGEPAINRGPREMIRENLEALALQHTADGATSGKGLQHTADGATSKDGLSTLLTDGAVVTIAVPGGADIARRTFNPRLGIEGGISIIGVSGIIKPFSEEAFIDSIRKCMTVAKASGTDRVVINSGAKSERYVRALYPDLPPPGLRGIRQLHRRDAPDGRRAAIPARHAGRDAGQGCQTG